MRLRIDILFCGHSREHFANDVSSAQPPGNQTPIRRPVVIAPFVHNSLNFRSRRDTLPVHDAQRRSRPGVLVRNLGLAGTTQTIVNEEQSMRNSSVTIIAVLLISSLAGQSYCNTTVRLSEHVSLTPGSVNCVVIEKDNAPSGRLRRPGRQNQRGSDGPVHP